MAISLERLQEALAGQYEVKRELGRGGMAVVFEAWDEAENRPVALKVLQPELAATVGGERFVRETQIAARLGHPHIVPVYNSGQAQGFLYYTMQYVDGETLQEKLKREDQLPVDEALLIARQVASALNYAHDQGVVHRDIKPGNIMLSDGGAVVMDFGIARALDEAGGDRLTETGLAMGTPSYMAPEQGESSDRLDGRSDQYSLACVLYEMLAGHPPFGGSNSQVILARHAKDPLPSLSTARTTVSGPIEAVVHKALAKTPADRFRSAQKFSEALDMAEQGVTPRDVTPFTGSQHYAPTWWGELARRRVYQVAASYAVIGWAAIEVADRVFPEIPVPAAANTWLLWTVIAGFPVALLLSWAFELTPAGVRRTHAMAVTPPTGAQQLKPMHRVLMTAGVLAAGVVGLVVSDMVGPEVEADEDGSGRSNAAAAGEPLDPTRIAILPLVDLTDDYALSTIGATVAYRIQSTVESAATLTPMSFAIAAQIVDEWDGAAEAMRAIEQSRFGSALVGQYQVVDGELKLHAEIVDVATKLVRRSIPTIVGPVADQDQLAEDFAQIVLGALAEEFDDAWATTLGRPAPIGAYRAFAEGAKLVRVNGNHGGAIAKLEEALQIDTGFVAAAYLAALSHAALGNFDERDRHLAFVADRLDRFTGSIRAEYDWLVSTVENRDQRTAYRVSLETNEKTLGGCTDCVAKDALLLNLPYTAIAVLDQAGGPFRELAYFTEPVIYTQALHRLERYAEQQDLADSARTVYEGTRFEGLFLTYRLLALAAQGEIEDVRQGLKELRGRTLATRCQYGYAARELWAHGQPAFADELFTLRATWFDENQGSDDQAGCEFGVPAEGEHAFALYEADQLEEARDRYEALLSAGPQPDWVANLYRVFLARAEARLGNGYRAREISADLLTRRDLFQQTYRGLAAVAALLGDKDEAFGLLDRAVRASTPQGKADFSVQNLVHEDRDFESLHDDARYEIFLRPGDGPVASEAGPPFSTILLVAFGLLALGTAVRRLRRN